MLREAWHVPGFATRARLRFSFLNSARHIVTETAKSSAQLSPALSEDVVWCSKQRVEINCLLHEISTEAAFTAEAHSRYIGEHAWLGYISTFRRKLAKSPKVAVKNPVDLSFLHEQLRVIAADSRSTTLTEEQTSTRSECKQFLAKIMLKDAEVDFADMVKANKMLRNTSDMTLPHECYPYARLMKRKIIFHGGPTNSGKTYQALQRLKAADPAKGGGVYCGPLRLLALEVFESLNRQGVYTDLSTGQEKREVDFSTHISCTVEMVRLDKEYDVAVIDEIQMIANDQRGFAWTRVLLGLRAREIHVCGGLEACELVRNLMASTGDDFELVEYKRLSTLQVSDESLRGDYSKIQPGDCIVAFSKADIFSIRRQIERLTPYKCAMIYGQLPPETRSIQARLFNEDNTGYDILVASDAIGMGLNLNIKRIVFHTATKRDGLIGATWNDPSSIKQIAGRAGRLSSNYKIGEVTAWQDADLAYIRGVMSWDIPPLTAAGIFPSVEQIDLFSRQLTQMQEDEAFREEALADAEGVQQLEGSTDDQQMVTGSPSSSSHPNNRSVTDTVGGSQEESVEITPAKSKPIAGGFTKFYNNAMKGDNVRLSALVEKFVLNSKLDGKYYLCDHTNLILVSNWLHSIPLTLAERFVFANAPVDVRSAMSMTTLYAFAATYAMRRPVALNVRLTRQKPRDVLELSDLCVKHNTLDLYLWLSIRFPEFFVEREVCLEQKAFAIECIQSSLESPHLQHKFSHSSEYKSGRVKMLTGETLGLPPASYGEVRESFMKNIALIDPKYLYVFPLLAEEEEPQQQQRNASAYSPDARSNYVKKAPVEQSRRRDSTSRRISQLPVGLRADQDTALTGSNQNVDAAKSYGRGDEQRSTYDSPVRNHLAAKAPEEKIPDFVSSNVNNNNNNLRKPISGVTPPDNRWVYVPPDQRRKDSSMSHAGTQYNKSNNNNAPMRTQTINRQHPRQTSNVNK